MCVIMLCNDKKPTEEMVHKAYFQNDHGAGIAWRENGLVKWKKGLDEKGIQEMIASLELPFIAHFRIASVGGKSPFLCHPFPVERDVDLALEGETKGYVLFHNGHWDEWKSFSKETALKMGRRLPMGSWSDSRAMAWACHNYGPGILEMIDEKCVIFGPKICEVVRGNGWDKVNDVWCSNKHWDVGGHVYRSHDYRRNQGTETPPFGGRGDAHDKDDYFRNLPGTTRSTTRGSGGNLDTLPFAQVERMWVEQQERPRSEWKMSKKQYKRLRKKHEQEIKKQGRVPSRAIGLLPAASPQVH